MQVVPGPGGGVRLVEIEAVVAHHAAFDGAHAGFFDLLGQQVEHVHGLGWLRGFFRPGFGAGGGFRRTIGIRAGAESGIACAKQDQVAVQDATAVDLAAGDDVGGPGEGFDGQQGISGGGSDELGIRGRRKEPALVPSVELAAVERGHADAKVGMAQRRIGKNGADALGQRAFAWGCVCQGGVRRVCRGSGRALLLGLGNQPGGENQCEGKKKRGELTKVRHAGSLAGGREIAAYHREMNFVFEKGQ